MMMQMVGGLEETLYGKMVKNYENIAAAVWANLPKAEGLCRDGDRGAGDGSPVQAHNVGNECRWEQDWRHPASTFPHPWYLGITSTPSNPTPTCVCWPPT